MNALVTTKRQPSAPALEDASLRSLSRRLAVLWRLVIGAGGRWHIDLMPSIEVLAGHNGGVLFVPRPAPLLAGEQAAVGRALSLQVEQLPGGEAFGDGVGDFIHHEGSSGASGASISSGHATARSHGRRCSVCWSRPCGSRFVCTIKRLSEAADTLLELIFLILVLAALTLLIGLFAHLLASKSCGPSATAPRAEPASICAPPHEQCEARP